MTDNDKLVKLHLLFFQSDKLELIKKITDTIEMAFMYGQTDGSHHKTWVIDQMIRILTGDQYESFIEDFETGENGDEYSWDIGIAP